MSLLSRIADRFKPKKSVNTNYHISQAAAEGTGRYSTIGGFTYTGEKNLGEMGPIKAYNPEYSILAQRSWDLFLESEIAQTVINKYVSWVIGKGSKLQAEPEANVLKTEGITLDPQAFSRAIEAKFKLYKKSRKSSYSGMVSLNKLEAEAFKNSKVGGDVLVILRVINGIVKVQLIDGAHVISPRYGNELHPEVLANGNKIMNGIELSPTGQHVAYYVRKPGIFHETERIAARGKRTGMLMAYMVYGNSYRLDNHRGMPLLAVVFETAKKLERYKEATVGSAEERQKIAYMIEHQAFSTGENPLAGQTVRAYDLSRSSGGDLPHDTEGNNLANKIAATTQKQTFNLPLGSTIKEVTSKNELYFKDFYSVNIDLVCAAAQIPPNVAMSKYDANYSASRAALKDWENTLNVERANFSAQFMQPIYELFLEIEAMSRTINAPGYINAKADSKYMVLEAYRNARFTGAPVPHIDPVKEVEAERLKLGDAGAAIPLTTVEAATENLGGGDSDSNIEQFAVELKKTKDLDIKVEEPPLPGAVPKKKD